MLTLTFPERQYSPQTHRGPMCRSLVFLWASSLLTLSCISANGTWCLRTKTENLPVGQPLVRAETGARIAGGGMEWCTAETFRIGLLEITAVLSLRFWTHLRLISQDLDDKSRITCFLARPSVKWDKVCARAAADLHLEMIFYFAQDSLDFFWVLLKKILVLIQDQW